VVYHGTPEGGFDKFTKRGRGDKLFGRGSQKRPGISFIADPGIASEYAIDKEPMSEERVAAPSVYPAYLKVDNPWDYENSKHIAIALAALKAHPEFREWMHRDLKKGDWEVIESKPVQDAIRAAGFDGFYSYDFPGKSIQVFSPTQIKSAISNTGAFSKTDPRIRYSFAGPTASTSNLEAAKAMQAAGVSRENIWRDTGWWEITPGQWSYEIDDSLSSVKMEDGLLSDVLKQKEIFKAYPQLDKILVRFMDLGDTQRGSFDPKTNLIKINSNFPSEQQRSALHHEVQHIIQMQEGY